MRKIRIFEHISLDGVIQSSGEDNFPKASSGPMADRINVATKYVVTHRAESLEWGPVVGLGPDFVDGLRSLKAKDGALAEPETSRVRPSHGRTQRR